MPIDLIDLAAGARPAPIPLERFRHDGFRWLATPEAGPAIRSLEGWRSLQGNPGFRVLRAGRHRAVLAGRLPAASPGDEVIVKTSTCTRLQLQLLHLVGPTREAREWSHHLDALRHGLPVVRPLGLGQRYRAGTPLDSVLVTERWPHDATLAGLGEEHLCEVLRELGGVVARMNRVGLLHGDLHPDNVLVRRSGADRLRIVDWKHVVRRRRPRRAAVAQQLAKLVWQFRSAGIFRGDGDPREACFFAGYLEDDPDPGRLRAAVAEATGWAGARRAQRAETRCTSTNSTFVRLEEGSLRRFVRREPGLRLLSDAMLDPVWLARVPEEGMRAPAAEPGAVLAVQPLRGGSARDAWREANRAYALDASLPVPLAWIEPARTSGSGWLVSLEAAAAGKAAELESFRD
jgi:hypothetical protein